ncbi:hypothetical protein ISN75_06720 [Dyella marensis]|uniref:hypothetical protein n=1 Tax=Dyella marensis TaxID=500610 RepID=UPI0031E131CC
MDKIRAMALGMGLVGIGALSGCVTSKPMMMPSGQQGFAIKCPGAARDITDCYEKAAAVCPKGYDVVNQASESKAFVTASNGNLFGATGANRSIMVICKV